MATYDRDLGLVTAYGYAKSAGYTGTEGEFAQALAALEVPMPVSKGGTGATSLDDAGILTKDGVQISPGHKFFGGMTVFGDTPMVRFFRDDASFANTSRFYIIQASSKVVNNKRVINRPQFVAYSYDSTTGDQNNYYENYYLPPITPNRTTSVDYAILTSKTPVTVGQGGTGASTATQALTNLGGVHNTRSRTTLTNNYLDVALTTYDGSVKMISSTVAAKQALASGTWYTLGTAPGLYRPGANTQYLRSQFGSSANNTIVIRITGSSGLVELQPNVAITSGTYIMFSLAYC